MAGLRRTYVTIMGIILISYGIIMNMLGAIASFLHPGSYHHGAMGTPMWCGLAFIIFGAVNLVKGLERKREKRGIPVALPITNLLTVIVSTLCIALISWSMSAPGIVILTNHQVTEFSVTSQLNVTNGEVKVSDLQLSLIPVYSTIICSSIIILLMALMSMCMDCVGMISRARPAIAAEVHHGTEWDERDGPRRKFPITEDETSPPYHHSDAVGEVMYGNTPPVQPVQVVKTIERPSFHHHMDPNEDNHQVMIPYNTHHQQHNHAHQPDHTHQHDHAHQVSYEHGHPRTKQVTMHQPLPTKSDQRIRQYPYQPNSAPNLRETERVERRPNPYFYL